MASKAPSWNPYRYGFNNPIRMIDEDGLFETEAEAKAYAKEHNIKTGWFRDHKIKKQEDASYAINKNGHMAYYYGTGAVDPYEYKDNGSTKNSGSWFSKISSIFSRKSGTAFESENGNFGAKEHPNADYGPEIDGIINTADAMKSVQGASNPLGEVFSNGEAIQQLGDILDWGSDAGNLLYNLFPSDNKNKTSDNNPLGPPINDTLESTYFYKLNGLKRPAVIFRYDSGGIVVPYNPK